MRLRTLWHLALVMLGCGLFVLVVRYSLAAYLAETSPEMALIIDPGNPVALRTVAQKIVHDIQAAGQQRHSVATTKGPQGIRFNAPAELAPYSKTSTQQEDASPLSTGTMSEMLVQARNMVEMGLRSEPLDYRSLTLLAKVVEMQAAPGTAAEAALPYYHLAAGLSPRASDAIFWLLKHNIETGNYAEAVTQADTLLRTISRARPVIIPILVALAEKPEATELVQNLLAANPPWRELFFAIAHNSIRDARTPLTLLLALKATQHPPTDNELRGYLNFLMTKGFHDLSYYTWLQFLPPERLSHTGLLFNANFSDPPSGFPFDWNVSAGAGTVVEFLRHPDDTGKHALRVEFTLGRVQFGGVTQSVLVPPGRYVLSGNRKGGIEGRRGLRWRVYCLGPHARVIAETPMHLTPVSRWNEFVLEFEVPARGCPMQQIQLNLDSRSTSEQLVRGAIWYSDLSIRRLTETDSARNKSKQSR